VLANQIVGKQSTQDEAAMVAAAADWPRQWEKAILTDIFTLINAISTLFQRYFNAISTLLQRYFNAISTLIQR
jgi:hypothetical protein